MVCVMLCVSIPVGHGSTSTTVHDLLQPFHNNVQRILREMFEDQRRLDGPLHVQYFPLPNLQAAFSALETVRSEIRNNTHTPYRFAQVEFQVAYHTFKVQNVPVTFVLSDSSFTHNCQNGVELVEFLKEIFPGVYYAGIKEGCLMARSGKHVLLPERDSREFTTSVGEWSSSLELTLG